MLIHLKDRVVLKLIGDKEEILSLLQSMTTNLLNDSGLVYTLFLLPNGRFLFDSFIFYQDNCMMLDISGDLCDALILHIKRHKMRMELKIEKTDIKVFSDILSLKSIDPRSEKMGSRIYTQEEKQSEINENQYHIHRVKNGIVEAAYDMISGESIPIYFRMHELNAISLSKGCYIGQESVNRLFRTAEIRKKIICLVGSNEVTKGGVIMQNEKKIGTLCSIFDNYGFGLIDKEGFDENQSILINEFEFTKIYFR